MELDFNFNQYDVYRDYLKHNSTMLKREGKLSEFLLGPDYNIEFFKAFYENHNLVMRLSKTCTVMADSVPALAASAAPLLKVNFRMIL